MNKDADYENKITHENLLGAQHNKDSIIISSGFFCIIIYTNTLLILLFTRNSDIPILQNNLKID